MSILKYPVVKLLDTPNALASTVTEGKMGESVTVLEELGDWLEIQTDWDNYPGFVPKEAVANLEWQVENPLITASLTSLVYLEAKVQSPILQRLPIGIKLTLLESSDCWFKVQLPEGTIGYIQKGDTVLEEAFQFTSLPKLRASLVAWALKFNKAVPYVWGGTSSFGTDCSGFVQHLYRLHNLPLERDASEQGTGKHLVNIQRGDILPGDLIFFTGFSHVGMAISHFDFIHATTNTKPVVQISQIDDPHWATQTIQYSRYKF